jgi:hypothetical protein
LFAAPFLSFLLHVPRSLKPVQTAAAAAEAQDGFLKPGAQNALRFGSAQINGNYKFPFKKRSVARLILRR